MTDSRWSTELSPKATFKGALVSVLSRSGDEAKLVAEHTCPARVKPLDLVVLQVATKCAKTRGHEQRASCSSLKPMVVHREYSLAGLAVRAAAERVPMESAFHAINHCRS